MLRLGLSLILRSARERSSAVAGRKQFCKNNHTQPGNCLLLGPLLRRRPQSLARGRHRIYRGQNIPPSRQFTMLRTKDLIWTLFFLGTAGTFFKKLYMGFANCPLAPVLPPSARGTRFFGEVLCVKLRPSIFTELSRERIASPLLSSQTRALRDGAGRGCLPARWQPRTPFPLVCPRRWDRGIGLGCCGDGELGSAALPSPKAGGGDARLGWCRSRARLPPRGACQGSGRVNNKAGAAFPHRYVLGCDKVGLAAFVHSPFFPAPNNGLQNGATLGSTAGPCGRSCTPVQMTLVFHLPNPG